MCPELKGCSSYFTLYSLKHPLSSKGPRCDLGGDINSSQGASFRKKWHVLCVDPQQTRDIHPMLDQCWATVYDAGPALIQHCVDISRLVGSRLDPRRHLSSDDRQTGFLSAAQNRPAPPRKTRRQYPLTFTGKRILSSGLAEHGRIWEPLETPAETALCRDMASDPLHNEGVWGRTPHIPKS